MVGRMVFIIEIFDEILDREVPASLLHGVFIFYQTLTSETKKPKVEAKRSRMQKESDKKNQLIKKGQKDKALINFHKGRWGMFTCQVM